MSYLVLARKYRPQTFEEVYAQEHITKILTNTIEMDRIAHAYLFTGPRGVGKTSMARIFAKSLNCLEGGPTSTPCNKCLNCQEVTQGISADVIEIDGASNTGVDDIRGLQKELMYSTSNSNYKIYIIDEVHMLSKNAFNALLKTLEEPPENVIFIFATTEPHKVLPTIISRCQRFDFKLIPISSIIERLKSICKFEEITAEEDAFFVIAKKADGSMRDALSLMDQVLAYGKNHITIDDVLEIFGIVHTDIFNIVFSAIVSKDSATVISNLHSIIEKGNDLQEFINGLLEHARNILLIKLGITVREISNTYKDKMKEIAESFEENNLLYLMSLLIKMKTDIKTSSNPILIAEMGFIKLTKLAEMKSINKLLEEISANPSSSGNTQIAQPTRLQPIKKSIPESYIESPISKPIDIQEPKTAPLSNNIQTTNLTKDLLNQEFKNLKTKMSKDKPFLAANLVKCKLDSIKNNFVHFFTDNKLAFNRLQDEKRYLSDLFSQHFSTKIKVDFSLKEVKKNTTIVNPTMDKIKEHSPELAKFIEITDTDLS
ncbi:MAG: DNA polymerase III subunit gamma/tau [Candidatus Cloacimonetes bacterium]|nr:DNA polymerase III subunit gamma/tau [Candidatus Cloacimonadota bacterium]